MCLYALGNSSPNFSKINLNFLFEHCDDLCTNFYRDITHDLLSYLSWSSRKHFKYEECYRDMYNRIHPDDMSYYTIYPYEKQIFIKRFKFLNSNNLAYELACKVNPTVTDLETFSRLEPCFSILFPLKCYLMDHPDLKLQYKGMLPFGREIVRYYNSLVPPEDSIKGSPTFKDHLKLNKITLRKASSMNMPTVTINNIMYWLGKEMSQDNTESDE